METLHLDTGKIFKYEDTPEGYLKVWLTVSKVGELDYFTPSGKKVTQVLNRDELFNRDSLDTAWGKPVTYHHPESGEVNADNFSTVAKGFTTQGMVINGDFLTLVSVLTDKELIADVKTKKVSQVSAGYYTKLKPTTDGKFEQTQRRYNHFAIVPKGRAGADVKVNLDADGEAISEVWESELINLDSLESNIEKNQPTENKIMKSVIIDGISYQIEDNDLLNAIVNVQKNLDSAKNELQQAQKTAKELQTNLDAVTAVKSQVEGEKDALQVKLDAAESTNLDADTIASEISQRLEIWSMVLPVLQKDSKDAKADYSLTVPEIKKLYLKKVSPSINLDGKDDNYISGVWDVSKPTAATKDTIINNTDSMYSKIEFTQNTDAAQARSEALKRQADRISANGRK